MNLSKEQIKLTRREKERDKERCKDICQRFHETCTEGYQFLLNILIDGDNRKDDEEALKSLLKLKIKVYKILQILFENIDGAIREFCNKRDAINHFISFPKEVARKYKGNGNAFVAYLDMVGSVAIKDVHLFEEYFLKKARVLRTTSPIMLDSDNLNAPTFENLEVKENSKAKPWEILEQAKKDHAEKVMII